MLSLLWRLQSLFATGGLVLLAVLMALAVDSRLDRHWIVRALTLLLAVCCALLLGGDRRRRMRQIIAAAGVLMFGVVFPVTTSVWSSPPEVDFVLQVATDAEKAAEKSAQSVVTVDDVKAAVTARGGAVGTPQTEKTPVVRGADAFPLIVRTSPTATRPWACVSFTGLEAKVRAC
ncbi:hypothetical protein HPO96_01315 [Kribbella sandramycini]|uniref:Uncharacterized protein n=1 Tax=Kribbella sandramycini TaxID=60450 RepID=A0A7Y4KUP9_9ACTN|nr:hypothetical protein [Kribbella sandramycini]MBB6568538.1 hypothetical protein [Kribbella sandramycini]NOL38874.1 hypothetical protein [Kribbella sandramycini]